VALDGLVIGVAAYKLALLGVNAALRAQAFWNGIAELSTMSFTKATNAQKVALLIYKGVMLAVTGATRAWAAAQWLLERRIGRQPSGPDRGGHRGGHRGDRGRALPRIYQDQAVPGLRQRPLGRHEGLRGMDPGCGT
jgi:hypothetical protein